MRNVSKVGSEPSEVEITIDQNWCDIVCEHSLPVEEPGISSNCCPDISNVNRPTSQRTSLVEEGQTNTETLLRSEPSIVTDRP